MEIKAYCLSVYKTNGGDLFSYIETLKLVKHKNNRYMWAIRNTELASHFYNIDDSINIFLKGSELSMFGSFYFFKESHLEKNVPFWCKIPKNKIVT